MQHEIFIHFIYRNCRFPLQSQTFPGDRLGSWALGTGRNERCAGTTKRGRKDAFITFEPDQKRLTGNGGCNRISGNYRAEKNTIQFTDVISTKMSCDDIEFENTFLSALGSINHYEVKGNDLLLKRKRETLLVLRAK